MPLDLHHQESYKVRYYNMLNGVTRVTWVRAASPAQARLVTDPRHLSDEGWVFEDVQIDKSLEFMG